MKHRTNHYNAIVVGAGPAGCSAAYYLKESGKSVLMLDKMSFPRHKPCAGGITKKTLKHLPIDISNLVKHTAKKICRGNYIYRGHEILKIDCYSGKPFWNVFTKEVCKHTGIETPYCGDATNTLADAKDALKKVKSKIDSGMA